MNPTPDAGTIEVLWFDLSQPLRKFIRSRVEDDATTDDILQDVFLRIHSGLCCLRRTDAVRSWAYRIARNAIIDAYRARRHSLPLVEDLPADDGISDVSEDLRAVLAASLRQTVDSLPEPYREALILVDFEDWDQASLARKQGLSLSGAKSRVQRARRMLRDALLACCHFEFDARGGILDYYERCCCCCQPR